MKEVITKARLLKNVILKRISYLAVLIDFAYVSPNQSHKNCLSISRRRMK